MDSSEPECGRKKIHRPPPTTHYPPPTTHQKIHSLVLWFPQNFVFLLSIFLDCFAQNFVIFCCKISPTFFLPLLFFLPPLFFYPNFFFTATHFLPPLCFVSPLFLYPPLFFTRNPTFFYRRFFTPSFLYPDFFLPTLFFTSTFLFFTTFCVFGCQPPSPPLLPNTLTQQNNGRDRLASCYKPWATLGPAVIVYNLRMKKFNDKKSWPPSLILHSPSMQIKQKSS